MEAGQPCFHGGLNNYRTPASTQQSGDRLSVAEFHRTADWSDRFLQIIDAHRFEDRRVELIDADRIDEFFFLS